ncbi:hypothetical protein HU200_039517 [Digitaria exilis]|uniref:DCD domain-containing protein n=1 Tax=Digitaria exilis TaxID=1010633 RepID=A0A835EKY5_9POAL|nr:hypothetical protein HU200_039517 [Digitaria exilis]
MRREGPALSFRQDAVGDMTGAIFMSNTLTREQCFKASIFGLPSDYEPFVSNVRKGMPLFLFDHTLRTLYGVFEAASDGGLNVSNAAFRSTLRSYPAQVRINIIWKCRPLSEDEFFPAIEDNYYQPRKFYFDLSYEQVVRLYELFNDRRVQFPIRNYSKNESLETNHSSEGSQYRESLTPDVPHSIDQSRLSNPNISEVVRRYSTPTSMHAGLPLSVEAHPNMSIALVTETFGAQAASTQRHHNQMELQSQSGLFPAATMTDAVSTQASAPCSQTSWNYHQLAAKQPYLLSQDYLQKAVPSGFTTQYPNEGAKFIANQSHPLSSGYLHSGLLASGYATQNPTYKGSSHLNSTFTPYEHLYPGLSKSKPQSNSDYEVHCDICFNQGSSAHSNIYECERQQFSEGEALIPVKRSLQAIPTYNEVLERDGKTVSAIGHKKRSADYIHIPDCDRDFINDQMKQGDLRSNASDPLDLENDIVNPRHTIPESNTKDRCSPPQVNVFSRLSVNKQLACQKSTTGPTLNQLVSSLSQKAEQWSHKNKEASDGLVIRSIREQAMDYSHAELNLPNQLELEVEGESMQTQVPLYNFKRRSETGKVDANLGKEISGKTKRRKLVRPSLEENNASANVGDGLKGNCTQGRKQNHLEVNENNFGIDLNVPAPSIDSDPMQKDNIIAVCSSVIKVADEINANKPNSNVTGTTKEQDPSSASAEKISIDLSVADLNSMDESKLLTILDQASFLLQALSNLKSGKSNSTEEARSSVCNEDIKASMVVKSDGGQQT